MTDDRLDETLRDLVRSIDTAPEPPREAMWAAIEARRRETRTARRFRRPAVFAPRTILRWAPAMAAALALGIGLGRWSDRPAPAPTPAGPAVAASADAPTDGDEVYTLVALRHLGSAEALLVGFPQDAREGRGEDVKRWAGDLLTDTRLLADSPAGDDPVLARLLGDLELVLAQIAALHADPRTDDVRLIEDGIESTDVLVRLRAATGDGQAAGL